jgi:hypothetical protein
VDVAAPDVAAMEDARDADDDRPDVEEPPAELLTCPEVTPPEEDDDDDPPSAHTPSSVHC